MLELGDIEAARSRVMEIAQETPLEFSHAFSNRCGANISLKLETAQRTGSFKIRGAANKLKGLTQAERDRGVIAASAGNHAQGVALAATHFDIDATIIMPEYAPISKVEATKAYGARVEQVGIDYAEAADYARERAETEGLTFVHAFDDEAIMAGQGTIGLELIEQADQIDTVVVPVGGGGLIAGIAVALKETDPTIRVVGVQSKGAASLPASLERGAIVELDAVDTIADGTATRRVGDLPFEVIREYVDEVVTVSDADIATAVNALLERAKSLAEGAGAMPLAAITSSELAYEDEEAIIPIISGGNIDLNVLTTVIMRGLAETGRYYKIRTVLKDRPGALDDLLDCFTDHNVNIYAIQHDRTAKDIAMNAAEVELGLETKGPDHAQALFEALEAAGYPVEILD